MTRYKSLAAIAAADAIAKAEAHMLAAIEAADDATIQGTDEVFEIAAQKMEAASRSCEAAAKACRAAQI